MNRESSAGKPYFTPYGLNKEAASSLISFFCARSVTPYLTPDAPQASKQEGDNQWQTRWFIPLFATLSSTCYRGGQAVAGDNLSGKHFGKGASKNMLPALCSEISDPQLFHTHTHPFPPHTPLSSSFSPLSLFSHLLIHWLTAVPTEVAALHPSKLQIAPKPPLRPRFLSPWHPHPFSLFRSILARRVRTAPAALLHSNKKGKINGRETSKIWALRRSKMVNFLCQIWFGNNYVFHL